MDNKFIHWQIRANLPVTPLPKQWGGGGGGGLMNDL